MTVRDRTGIYWTSPDLSITITGDEAFRVFELWDHCNWDVIESSLPPGAKDASGTPMDRRNRDLRLAVLAEFVALFRDGASGEGLALMDNPHYEQLINVMLNSFEDGTP